MAATILHISDFHIKTGDPYDRNVVLNALVGSVRSFRERGRAPDLVFATGDIAFSGKEGEYAIATTFFDALLKAAGLERRHLHVIPGNHDVDRDQSLGLARTLGSREDADAYFHADRPKPHLAMAQGAFVQWYNSYFDGIRNVPKNSSCGPAEVVEIRGLKLGILPLNSALFCRDDNDHAKLWIGRRCLDDALAQLGDLAADIRLALVHHPLDWLHDEERANIKTKLHSHVDAIFRGHLHETEIEMAFSAHGGSVHCAAGAAYQTRRWPNRAAYYTIDAESLTVFPIRYEDQPREVWTVDPSIFPDDDGFTRRFILPRFSELKTKREDLRDTDAAQPAAPARKFASNIPSRGSRPFVGREDLLKEIRLRLDDAATDRVVVLHGASGTGKSELAREFARCNQDRYPGGTFLINAGDTGAMVDFARIGQHFLGLNFPQDLSIQDRCQQTFLTLGFADALLIYDNVRSIESIEMWCPLVGMSCHILITSVVDRWDTRWDALEVQPLTSEASLKLIEQLAGPEVTNRFGTELAESAGGLPIQIVPAAVTLAYEARRGHLESARLTLSREAKESYRGVYEQLPDSARLLLHTAAFLNFQRIIRTELFLHLEKGSAWTEGEYREALDTCLDLHLLEGEDEVRMHQLFAMFLRGETLDAELAETLDRIRSIQALRLAELARSVASNPADTELTATMMLYPLTPRAWQDGGVDIPASDGEMIGRALSEIGQFSDALPWFKQAVETKQKGDIQGQVDHESLGRSLHQVGYCLLSDGKFAEAIPWLERAVETKQKGDSDDLVDHESLGTSLDQIGYCLVSTGKFAEAISWLERAVEEKEKGDIQGHVNHQSLGISLHQVGSCLSNDGKFAEAIPWFERTIEEKEKGNVYGRADHESLGMSLHQVGFCLSSDGKFAEALPWFERAVEEAKKGDWHGRVDHQSLGASLHQVGSCLSSDGKFAEALPWFEQAVEETKKGNWHGRVDHQSLGASLHQVGYCLSSDGKFAEAIPWFECAIEEKQKGNVHGRTDHDSLGMSLHQVGFCLSSDGKFAEALPWFERAVEEAKKGDRHGRVDHESLGTSLHQVGYCLARDGKFAEALPWIERSVEIKRKGNVHGHVDSRSLVMSLHDAAYCLRHLEREEEARMREEEADSLK